MIEIPESITISRQAERLLTGKTISKVINASNPHRFAWYNGKAEKYPDLLEGHTVTSAQGHGAFVTIHLNNDTHISISDGTHMKYYPSFEKHPAKHQLLIEFDDHSFLVFTVSMYGCIFAYRGKMDHPYHINSLLKISPLDDKFDESYFESLFNTITKDISVKAFLGTEQRIPGVGNGVLQDILFNARLNPRRKISTLSDLDKSDLFHCLKTSLRSMTDKGGRNTEKDFYGNIGGYKCILSKNTYKMPCHLCGSDITKEAYLGGTVYYCPSCQPLE